MTASRRAWLAEAVSRIEADFNRSSDTHLVPLRLPAYPDIDVYLKDESSHPTGNLKHRLARSLFLYALVNGWLEEVTEKLMLNMPDDNDLNLAGENIRKAGELLEDMTREDPKFAEQLAESLKPSIASFATLQGSHTITSFRENIQNLLSGKESRIGQRKK